MKLRYYLYFAFTIIVSYTVSAEEILVIGNQNVPETSVNKEWIKNVYVGNITKWSNNEPIIIVIMDDKRIHKSFLIEYIKRTPSQFNAVWRYKMYTGANKLPKMIKTEEEVLDFVANNQGAIGYIASEVSTAKVKVIHGDTVN